MQMTHFGFDWQSCKTKEGCVKVMGLLARFTYSRLIKPTNARRSMASKLLLFRVRNVNFAKRENVEASMRVNSLLSKLSLSKLTKSVNVKESTAFMKFVPKLRLVMCDNWENVRASIKEIFRLDKSIAVCVKKEGINEASKVLVKITSTFF